MNPFVVSQLTVHGVVYAVVTQKGFDCVDSTLPYFAQRHSQEFDLGGYKC